MNGYVLLFPTPLYRAIASECVCTPTVGECLPSLRSASGEKVVVKAVNKKKVLESNVYTEIEVLRKVLHPYIIRLYAAYEQGKNILLSLCNTTQTPSSSSAYIR